ncbi:MAG: hypothetical protein K6E94_04150 [Elusimicrobiaceae bacterium]|nr:hypothetical protein [Elusimicrobiaceae bacterium]
MKKIIFFLFIVFAGFLYAQEQKQTVSENPQGQEQQEFKPLLADADNSASVQNDMLANTYRVEDIHQDENGEIRKGFWTAFRIHKNWFLTCAHGPFMDRPEFQGKDGIPIHVTAREYDAPGSAAPFALEIDLTKTDGTGNGIYYKFKKNLMLDGSNNNRGDDLALIYVSDADPSKQGFKKTKNEIKKMKEQLNAMKGMFPEHVYAQMEKEIAKAEKKSSSVWQRFLNNPIKPFHLFILSEETVINELGYPGKTKYSFPLTAYHIHPVSENGSGFMKFNFVPIGTHKGTHAIFYKRVNNLAPGTSGAPMFYGNYVVSVDSATNCSPMLTDKFYKWLKNLMGSDYKKGMCVEPKPAEGNGGVVVPVKVKNDPNWNNAMPNP